MKTSAQQRQAFGNALACARQTHKMTQREVARALNVSQGLISGWETGSYEPSPRDACRVEEVLGVDPGELTRHLGYLPLAAAGRALDSGAGAGSHGRCPEAERLAALEEDVEELQVRIDTMDDVLQTICGVLRTRQAMNSR